MDIIKNFYGEIDRDKTDESVEDSNFRKILKLFEKSENARFLDIGCYDGSKTVMIRNFTGAEAYGVDFLPDRLALAKERGIKVKTADLNKGQKIDFIDEFFDFIFCGDVIEHLFSPDFLLEEIYRLLKPGGYAVITTPNLATWKNRVSLLFGWQPVHTEVSTKYRVGNPRLPKGPPSGHIRLFTPRALKELVEAYGFVVEIIRGEIVPADSPILIERFTGIIDRILLHLRSSMCDKIVVKIRKP
ncbi:MAG: class I SAM-dependent methyltransferase [Candidatus Hydrothermarchaeota archaeon]|nr:class I SAM-dependent methyltransferase [Candidatus Hydrothermarchaeota archaeon]